MKISASIYSDKKRKLPELVRELDDHQIDLFHVDCIDNFSVFEDIEAIKKISKTPIDLHIISPEPEQYFPYIQNHEVEWVTFQYEELNHRLEVPHSIDARLGLAIMSETPIDVFEEYKDRFDFILFMTTTPGKSGGIFNKSNFNKIRQFKKRFQGTRIHVDGGVNEEVSFILRNMGVTAVVTGSYLLNADYVGAALLNLKSDRVTSHYFVRDFMVGLDEVPQLPENNFSFKDVLQSIENFNLGFTTVVNKDRKLMGISTNADVRRALLRHIDNLQQIPPEACINKKPVVVHEDRNVNELLKLIRNLSFPLLYVPVVDHQHRLTGAVTFNNLIKGES